MKVLAFVLLWVLPCMAQYRGFSATKVISGWGGGQAEITVEEADGNPSVTPISVIQFNQAHGITVWH